MKDSLENLYDDISKCTACELRQNASQPVGGIGDAGAKYFLIGEAPGREEDEQGCPFVGASGRRLNELLGLAGIDLNDCYLSNVCRCRPPSNRTPRKKEIAACVNFLWRELKIIHPQIVIPLGATPLGLFCEHGISQMHGCEFDYEISD